jgi:hypothetical protein
MNDVDRKPYVAAFALSFGSGVTLEWYRAPRGDEIHCGQGRRLAGPARRRLPGFLNRVWSTNPRVAAAKVRPKKS